MQIKALAWAVALAMTVTVTAEPDRPRIYYPRNVKRAFGNSTTTAHPKTSVSPDTTSMQSSTKRDPLLGGALSDILDPLIGSHTTASTGTATSTKTKTKDADTTGTKTKTKDQESSTATDSGIVVAPTGIVSSTSAKATSTSTDDGGLLDPILTAIIPQKSSTSTSSKDDSTTSTKDDSTSTKTSDSASTTAETTTTDGGLLPTLTSLLPPLGDSTTTSASSTSGSQETSTSGDSATSTDTSVPTSAPTSLSSMYIPSSTDVPVVNNTSTDDLSSATSAPTSLPSLSSSDLTTTDVSVTNTTAAEPTTMPTVLPTDTTSASGSSITETSKPAPATSSSPDTATPTTTASPTETPTETATEAPTTTPSAKPVTSIGASGTLSNSDDWLPKTFVGDSTSFSFTPPTKTATGTSSTGLPSNIPKVIVPNNPPKKQPHGTEKIVLTMKYPLNYQYVAQSPQTASQMFTYMPVGLCDAVGISSDKCVMIELGPLDLTTTKGYYATLVYVYMPKDVVATLQSQIHAPNSPLYHNDVQIVSDLTNNIDPNMDITGNISDDGDSTSDTPDSGSNNKNNDDTFGGSANSNTTSSQAGVTAGIAIGAVSLSALYGAAMFIVARRYKRKKQGGHARSSSIGSSQASSDMQFTGTGSPALMGGALLSRENSGYGGVAGGRDSQGSGRSGANNSARTAGISAPVAAENSLGWN